MSTTLRNTCVAILLFASIPWQSCFGWISLCLDNSSFSHNGTSVIAEIGQPASVSFCVDTNYQVHPYFKIQHPRVGTEWLSNSSKFGITTQIVKDKTKAIITITINPVEQGDFLDKFYLTVYREPMMNNNLQLWFQLEKKEGERNTEDGGKPPVTTQSEILRDDITSTTSRCLPYANSGCPESWYPVPDYRCIRLFPRIKNVYSTKQCSDVGGEVLETKEITELKTCLEYLLKNTTLKIVRSQGNNYNVLTGMKVQKQSDYNVVCRVNNTNTELVSPAISEFYVETMDGYRKRKNILLIGSREAKLDVTNNALTVVCRATGLPSPEVTLSRDNITLTDFISGSLWIRKPDCGNSGLYTCHARNFLNFTRAQAKIQFQSPIKINPITFTNQRTGSTRIQSGDDVSVNCSVTGCPYPDALTLGNEVNLTLSAYGKSSVIHEMTRVQCSDMGSYYCRAEAEDLEDRRDLLVERCPIQLCRGQEDSVTISRNVNQTTSFSVCLMSDERPTWENSNGSKSISVVFTRRSGGGIYFSARINISKIEDGDNDVSIIVMRNRHGSLHYHIKLQSVKSLSPLPGNNQKQSPSSEQTNLLPIVLPLVLVLSIVFAVIVFVVHRQKVKRYNETISALMYTITSKETTNNEIQPGEYENITGVEPSVKLMPVVSEEEDESKTYCVILEY